MTESCAVIHIIRAENRTHELLHNVVIFVGRLCGAQTGQRVGPVFAFDPGKSLCYEIDGLLPSGFLQFAVFSDKGVGQPIVLPHKIHAESSFDTRVSIVGNAPDLTGHAYEITGSFVHV